jgi:hypothetical protein
MKTNEDESEHKEVCAVEELQLSGFAATDALARRTV